MSEESKKNLDISISSTNVPTIEMCEDKLTLSFLNWDYQNIELEFNSTLAFRWLSQPCADNLDDDMAYEVFESDWLEELLFCGEPRQDRRTGYHHYQFYVYGCWLFEVVAKNLGMKKEEPEIAQESWAKCAF